MNIVIKKMETDAEIKGKAYVHWKSWQEAYSGIVDQRYLDSLTLDKCEKIAFRRTDNVIIAKDGDSVIGFVGFGKYRNVVRGLLSVRQTGIYLSKTILAATTGDPSSMICSLPSKRYPHRS